MRVSTPVKVFLKVSISVAIEVAIVIGNAWVGAISFLPPVRHTVFIGIPVCRTTRADDVQAVKALRVALPVDKSFVMGIVSSLGICSVKGLLNHTSVMIVEFGWLQPTSERTFL